jgi:hypothetical protein
MILPVGNPKSYCFPFNPILSCYRGFKQDCPDGQLGKDKILEMYSMILPAGNAKVDNALTFD